MFLGFDCMVLVENIVKFAFCPLADKVLRHQNSYRGHGMTIKRIFSSILMTLLLPLTTMLAMAGPEGIYDVEGTI